MGREGKKMGDMIYGQPLMYKTNKKSKAKNDFLKNICMEHLLTYGDDYCQNIHEREKFDSKNKCVDEISQRQCINNG